MLRMMCQVLLFLLCLGWSGPVEASKELLTTYILRAERIAGPFVFPWSLAFLPNGEMLVSEKLGRLKLVREGRRGMIIGNVPRIHYGSQGGLLDVVTAPDYARSKDIYLSYSYRAGANARVRVMKARFDRDVTRLSDHKVIFETNPSVSGETHLGGRMVVTRKGELFLTLGGGGDKARPHSLSGLVGGIVRIRTNGKVPKSNPFVGQKDVEPEIWSYGNHNPQGLALDVKTGELWASEYGSFGEAELNLIKPGQNYGWPPVSYAATHDAVGNGGGTSSVPEEIDPVYATASTGISGLAVVRHGKSVSFWIGGLDDQMLLRVLKTPDGHVEETRFLEGEIGRIRDVRYGPDGFLYVLTDSSRGYLYRLFPG